MKWHEYFMRICDVVATRSTCCKRQVGALIVKDKHIVASGYNGTPPGYKNCNEGGCPRCNDSSIPSGEGYDKCLCAHAEQNAIAFSARYGVSTNGATMYITEKGLPCIGCAKNIIASGIKTVVVRKFEKGTVPETWEHDLFSVCGIKVIEI